MAAEQYLNKTLKQYYLLDFEQVLLIKDPFWGIPEDVLRRVLSEINTSENIQTLYSKIKHENDEEDDESYLVIAFTKEVEVELTESLKTFASSFPGNTISMDKMPPSENLNVGPAEYQIGAINNKNYFNLHHFRITFISKNIAPHEGFWTQLKELLVNF